MLNLARQIKSSKAQAGLRGKSFRQLAQSVVPPWNLDMAKAMFTAKDRAAAWDLIADLLDSGLDDVRAIGLAADMFKHRGNRAAAMVLGYLRASFAAGDFEDRMASVTKGAEALVFSNAGRVTGAVVYRGAARVLRNQRAIRDAVVDATAKPAALSLVLIALLVLMGLRMFPTFEELLPRDDWPQITKTVAAISDFLISGGVWAAGGFAAFVVAIAISLPFLAAVDGPFRHIRASLDRFPPWSFYRLQTGAAFSFAVVEIGRELCPKVGDGLKRAAYHGGVERRRQSQRERICHHGQIYCCTLRTSIGIFTGSFDGGDPEWREGAFAHCDPSGGVVVHCRARASA